MLNPQELVLMRACLRGMSIPVLVSVGFVGCWVLGFAAWMVWGLETPFDLPVGTLPCCAGGLWCGVRLAERTSPPAYWLARPGSRLRPFLVSAALVCAGVWGLGISLEALALALGISSRWSQMLGIHWVLGATSCGIFCFDLLGQRTIAVGLAFVLLTLSFIGPVYLFQGLSDARLIEPGALQPPFGFIVWLGLAATMTLAWSSHRLNAWPLLTSRAQARLSARWLVGWFVVLALALLWTVWISGTPLVGGAEL